MWREATERKTQAPVLENTIQDNTKYLWRFTICRFSYRFKVKIFDFQLKYSITYIYVYLSQICANKLEYLNSFKWTYWSRFTTAFELNIFTPVFSALQKNKSCVCPSKIKSCVCSDASRGGGGIKDKNEKKNCVFLLIFKYKKLIYLKIAFFFNIRIVF